MVTSHDSWSVDHPSWVVMVVHGLLKQDFPSQDSCYVMRGNSCFHTFCFLYGNKGSEPVTSLSIFPMSKVPKAAPHKLMRCSYYRMKINPTPPVCVLCRRGDFLHPQLLASPWCWRRSSEVMWETDWRGGRPQARVQIGSWGKGGGHWSGVQLSRHRREDRGRVGGWEEEGWD
jgi:hypothetical protein